MKQYLPAYPLFVKDPNFSLWCYDEYLTSGNVKTWYGEEKKLYGFLKVDGETFGFLGNVKAFSSLGVKIAEQTDLKIDAFSTEYTFACNAATLRVRFTSPLRPDDLEMIGLPVCYMEYEVTGADHVEISLFANRNLTCNTITKDRRVLGMVLPLGGFEAAGFGLMRQLPLSNHADLIGADWGYYYLAGEHAEILDERELDAYLAIGASVFSGADEERYIAAFSNQKHGKLLIGYDDTVAIDYFGKYTKGYYLENHTISEALTYVWENLEKINASLAEFDSALIERAKPYGNGYLNILYASLRQSIAGHKLVRDENGEVLWLSKECDSNGCIGTVDVSYPSMPLYLLYNPELVKGMMRPILKFARMPVWNYDFAPHDVGTYPAATGQVYGLVVPSGEKYAGRLPALNKADSTRTHFPIYTLPKGIDVYRFEKQMPVEECANMLIMFLAAYESDKDISFFRDNLDLAEKWVGYLTKYGLYPEEQLCTDDFAGHLKNNVNLAIKATVGIAAYAKLVGILGDADAEHAYRATAEKFADTISEFGNQYPHIPLTWDSGAETFSLKYNFAFDKIYGLGLFDQALLEREVDCYIEKQEPFGTPLDSRKTYTKSDWQMWCAALTDHPEKKAKMIDALNHFLTHGKDRQPFNDWYWATDSAFIHFRARTVQGGCFILLM